MANEIQEFLTGVETPDPERVLASILFTDIVRLHATEQATWATADGGTCSTNTTTSWSGNWSGSAVAAIKGDGDGVLATFSGPAAAVQCATAIRSRATPRLEFTAGVHVEIELRGVDVGGIAVHIAARVQALAEPGEVLVSRTVVDLVAGSDVSSRIEESTNKAYRKAGGSLR